MGDARAPTTTGSWVDDLATIVASWRDARPVRNRIIVLVAALAATPRGHGPDQYLALALLAFALLPRVRFAAGPILRWTAALVAVGGAVLVLAHEPTGRSLHDPTRRVGSLLFAAGVLAGGRKGPVWPWFVIGLAVVPFRSVLFPPFADWQGLGGTLALLVVARTAFAVRGAEAARGARDRLAVRVQARPWMASFILVGLALCVPVALGARLPGLSGFGASSALVGVAFLAAWRSPSLFTRAAPWTAVLVIPPAVGALNLLLWRGSMLERLGLGDWALTPWWLLPLVAGLIVGRRAPVARPQARDAALIVALCALGLGAEAVVQHWWLEAVNSSGNPSHYAGLASASGLPFLLAFFVAATSCIATRSLIWGSLALGVAEVATLLAVFSTSEDADMKLSSCAPFVLASVSAALICVLARDTARVTHVPPEHPIVTDWTPVSRDSGA